MSKDEGRPSVVEGRVSLSIDVLVVNATRWGVSMAVDKGPEMLSCGGFDPRTLQCGGVELNTAV